MCYETREPVFICTAKMLDSSTGLSVGALFRTRRNDSIIRQSLLFDTQTTCSKDAGACIYIYREKARLVYWSTAAVAGAVLKSKRSDHTTPSDLA